MTDLKKEGAAAQPVISIDSLAPAAIERKAESIGVTKNALTLSRLIPLALAAGFLLALADCTSPSSCLTAHCPSRCSVSRGP